MPERPLLLLPRPAVAEKARRFGGGGQPRPPSREVQGRRIEPKLDRLTAALEARRARVTADPQGTLPEEVLVLEVVGTLDNFANSVRRIPGLEWLAEVEIEDVPPDEDFYFERNGVRTDKTLPARLFLVFSDQAAMRELRALWERWKAGQALARGYAPWGHAFLQLRDIRPWGVQDRLLETGVLDDWREREQMGAETVTVEIELWHRETQQRRDRAEARVRRLVGDVGGDILTSSVISEIGYHALLARLPIATVREFAHTLDGELLLCEQIQFFRATGQMASAPITDERATDAWAAAPGATAAGSPTVALLDGLPLENHQRLAGRLRVDDPDDFAEDYEAGKRVHGTSMASLIVHGDLEGTGAPLNAPLYVRPILRPSPTAWPEGTEMVPPTTLVPDLVHRAVRRMFVGDGIQEPAAPTVRVVNLSVGIRDRPFLRVLSPLARLLDHVAWKHRVLFLVSAGNHLSALELGVSGKDAPTLARDRRETEVLKALIGDTRHRRLLSPAEAINVLTVGALHADRHTGVPHAPVLDPYESMDLASPVSALGPGFRRAIKPDILMPGGRQLYTVSLRPREDEPALLEPVDRPVIGPGLRVAAPSPSGRNDATVYAVGTSGATALATRTAALLDDVLEALRAEPGGAVVDDVPRALWLKAMLAHGASWGEARRRIETVCGRTRDDKPRERVSALMGYGVADGERVVECTAHRVTVLSGGELADEQAHVHRLPLPPGLSGWHGLRRLIVTLAWFTPVNPMHQHWRRGQLWLADPSRRLDLDRDEGHHNAVQRGTLQHEIFVGDRATAFVDGEVLEIKVNCRTDAGQLTATVPYALAVTLEVDEAIGVDIYSEVRVRVLQQVQVRPVAG